jgi:hypothetical protein
MLGTSPDDIAEFFHSDERLDKVCCASSVEGKNKTSDIAAKIIII